MKNSIAFAFRRSIPIMVGFFPVGIAYGILMANAGYNFVWSGLTSLIVFAGSLQMLMITFFQSDMSMLTVIVTALLLNSRHIFYGLSFIEKFNGYGKWKWFLIYGLPDESYSLLCAYKQTEGVDEKWVHIFSTAFIWLYWIVFSTLGGIVGSHIPFDTTGIDFALTALFVVILIEQIKGAASKLPALIAVCSSVVCIAVLGADSFLLPSLIITVIILLLLRGKLETKEAGQ
ncbi:MAG: AzlC family ABC transporter permease [Eubacteriales bacterium]|nr:AzlC family ABC transporter permease [Eubacteriales bacterium]